MTGATFTWSNFQASPSKLDRFLLSPKWNMVFPFSKGLARPRPISDHIPLVLCGKMRNGKPKTFKFENMWLTSPGFVDMVKS